MTIVKTCGNSDDFMLILWSLAGDTGWDIFCLHYNLQAPVNSVIPASSMLQYQQIFDFLWRMKRVEHSLSASWTKDMSLGHEVQVGLVIPGNCWYVLMFTVFDGCRDVYQGLNRSCTEASLYGLR